MSTWSKGNEGENLAADYLAAIGYEILERNFRFGHAEIDIVARDGDYTVFVEVKYRNNAKFGPAVASITPAKQKQIIRVTRGYIWKHQLHSINCRFDVVAIDLVNGKPDITHIKNAYVER
jgi:putative endonuclease